jgi:hypothetical protein
VLTERHTILSRRIFSVGEHEYRWENVVAAARFWSDWSALERETAKGMASLAEAATPPPEADVEAAAAEFRYARGLLAGEEMEAWLENWSLSSDEWFGYLRRRVLRARWGAELGDIRPSVPLSAGQVESSTWVEAVCSGEISSAAQKLAARVAACAAIGDQLISQGEAMAAIEAGFERYCRRVLTRAALQDAVDARQVEWLTIGCRVLTFPYEEMAREAQLCLRDGMTVEEVATRARTDVVERRLHLEEADPLFSSAALSGRPGALLGPLASGEEFALVLLDDKVPPSLDDPIVRRKAEEEALRHALEREVLDRVRWHERI